MTTTADGDAVVLRFDCPSFREVPDGDGPATRIWGSGRCPLIP